MTLRKLLTPAVVTILSWVTTSSYAAPPVHRADARLASTEIVEIFGESIAQSEDRILVGAPGHNQGIGTATMAGKAFVYVRSGDSWVQEARLSPADSAVRDFFGSALAIEGDTLVVTAPFAATGHEGSGAAYVFKRTDGEWLETAKLTGSGGASLGRFGHSLALQGDLLVVGAGNAVYAFRRSGEKWLEESVLTASDGEAGDRFGVTLSLSDDTLLIGAQGWDFPAGSAGLDVGAAYVYVRDGATWSEQARLTLDRPVPSDGFGAALAVSGDTAIIGAPRFEASARPIGLDTGAAFVFTRSAGQWSLETTISVEGERPVEQALFGASVAIDGDIAVIGGPRFQQPAVPSKEARAFKRQDGSWQQVARFVSPDTVGRDAFGATVAIMGSRVAIGAPYADNSDVISGAVFVCNVAASGESPCTIPLDPTPTEGQLLLEASQIHARTGEGPFDSAIAASGETVLFASEGDVHVYRTDGVSWDREAVWTSEAEDDESRIGIAIHGETAVVASPTYIHVYRDSGSWNLAAAFDFETPYFVPQNAVTSVAISEDVFAVSTFSSLAIFEREGLEWSESARIDFGGASDSNPPGGPVAIIGETVLVAGFTSSIVYVFRRSPESGHWNTDQPLEGREVLVGGPGFGSALCATGEYVAALEGDQVQMYRRAGEDFALALPLQVVDGSSREGVGASLACGENSILVGAPFASGPGITSGGAYRFEYTRSGWEQTGKLVASDAREGDQLGSSVALADGTALLLSQEHLLADGGQGTLYVYDVASQGSDGDGGSIGCNAGTNRSTGVGGLLLFVACLFGVGRGWRRSKTLAMFALALGLQACFQGGGSSNVDAGADNVGDARRPAADSTSTPPEPDAAFPSIVSCNPLTHAGCELDEKCANFTPSPDPGSVVSTCVPDGDRLEDESCTQGPPGALGYDDCVSGLHCRSGLCVEVCSFGPPDTCRSSSEAADEGLYCAGPGVVGDGAGLCVPACSPTDESVAGGVATNNTCGSGQTCFLNTQTGVATCRILGSGASQHTQNDDCPGSSSGSCGQLGCASGFGALLQNKPVNSTGLACTRFCTPVDTYLGALSGVAGQEGQCQSANLDALGGTSGNTSAHQCRFIQSFYNNTELVSSEVGMCVPVTVTGGGTWGDCELLDWDGLKAVWNGALITASSTDQAFNEFCFDLPDDLPNATVLPRCRGLFEGCLSLQEMENGLPKP